MPSTSLCALLEWNVRRLYYPFKTATVSTIPPRMSLCTILSKNITTSYYPFKTPNVPAFI